MGQLGAAAARTPAEDRNEVLLVGRLAGPPEERTLPSGDPITAFRVIVRRCSAAGRGHQDASQPPRRATVDTVDCTAWRAEARRLLRGWRTGDIVEVTGALRRRFWRSPGGPASRYDVEVARVRRLRSAAAEAGRQLRPGGS